MTRNNQKQVFKGGWEELENAVHTTNQTTGSSPLRSIFIKPDGTKLFLLSGNTVEVFPLSIPYDVATRGSIEDTFPVTDDGTPVGLFFKDDGAKMFVVGLDTMRIYEYVLPTPWLPSSIVDTPVSLSLSVVAGDVSRCAFSRDGDILLITDTLMVYSFPLPIPWDVTSNTASSSFDPTPVRPRSAILKPEGDKLYIGDSIAGKITEYDLSIINDVTTAILSGNSFTLSAMTTLGLFFRNNGMEFFNLSSATDITKFHFHVAWDISSASHFSNSFVDPNNDDVTGVTWKPDGTKFYAIYSDVNSIKEFTAIALWNITNAVQTGTFSVGFLDTSPQALQWRKNGNVCYFFGNQTDTVYQLNATTPYEVNSLSYNNEFFEPSMLPLTARGMFMRDDGKKIYISLEGASMSIREHDILTPFDLSTANTTPVGTLPLTKEPRDIFFKSDGSMLFIIAGISNSVERYILSTPWDITSAVFTDFVDLFFLSTDTFGLFIREDNGMKLFAIDLTTKTIFSLDMSLEFNFGLIDNLGDQLVTNLGDSLVYQ